MSEAQGIASTLRHLIKITSCSYKVGNKQEENSYELYTTEGSYLIVLHSSVGRALRIQAKITSQQYYLHLISYIYHNWTHHKKLLEWPCTGI